MSPFRFVASLSSWRVRRKYRKARNFACEVLARRSRLGKKDLLRSSQSGPLPEVALATVLIPKENILFLREWLEHYHMLGVSSFLLYDNGKVQKATGIDKDNPFLVPGSVSKHDIDFGKRVGLGDGEVDNVFARICAETPGTEIIPWEPRSEDGLVVYGQELALEDARKRTAQASWLLNCDVDEFLFLGGGLSLPELCRNLDQDGASLAYVGSVLMANRWVAPLSLVLENDRILDPGRQQGFWHGKKYLLKPEKARSLAPHSAKSGRARWLSEDEATILHYSGRILEGDEGRYRRREKDEAMAMHVEELRRRAGFYASEAWKKSVLNHRHEGGKDARDWRHDKGNKGENRGGGPEVAA